MAEAIENKEAVIETVLEGVAKGETLSELCRQQQIGRRTWYDWMDEDANLSARFARARREGFDAIAERAMRTARGKEEADGGESTKDIQRDKLIIETDLKLLAKWDPKRYGEKTLLGSDPDNPLPSGINVTFRSAKPADDDQGG